MSRADLITEFLDRNGWADGVRTPVAGDASFRRYERVTTASAHAILMDAPPPQEDVRPFIAVDGYLRSRQLSAPQIYAIDLEAGLLLLEDLGDQSFSRVLAENPEREEDLYAAAVETLAALHSQSPPKAFALGDRTRQLVPVHDGAALQAGLAVFCQWYLPLITGRANPAWEEQLAERFAPWANYVVKRNSVLALRDFHADNLMWLPRRQGVKRVGLLDFQDASLSHPAYDLVSLLQDARRDVSPDLEAQMIRHYLDCRAHQGKGLPETAFRNAYCALGVQRNTRILGVFARLWRRDGKPGYLKFMPRVWGLLERNLAMPDMADMRRWFAAQVPAAQRNQVPEAR